MTLTLYPTSKTFQTPRPQQRNPAAGRTTDRKQIRALSRPVFFDPGIMLPGWHGVRAQLFVKADTAATTKTNSGKHKMPNVRVVKALEGQKGGARLMAGHEHVAAMNIDRKARLVRVATMNRI